MKNVDLGAFKNNQWGNCYIDEQEILHIRLLIEMKQIMKELNEEQTNIAWAAYEYFKTYRETWCSFQKTLNFAPTPFVNHNSCIVEMTIEHLNKIIQSQMANESIRPDPREYE
jgi:DNA-binding MltR family transcriptional regulator